MTFDPDGLTSAEDGLFGLPTKREDARIIVLPAPFDGTTSFGVGCALGPEAIRSVSNQIDLFDLQFGRVYEAGIYIDEPIEGLRERSDRTRALADAILNRPARRPPGSPPELAKRIDEESSLPGRASCPSERLVELNRLGDETEALVRAAVSRVLAEGRTPVLLGGEHAMSLGAILAAAEQAGRRGDTIGVLQIDAHMDMHDAYAGMKHSHASVMFNALRTAPAVSKIVQVGIRDFAEREHHVAKEHADRVVTFFDLELRRRQDAGASWRSLCAEMIEPLPEYAYITFDIDGLDPSLCPNTGTPVPGGLSFHEASELLEALARSGRTIIAADLVEVTPGAVGMGAGTLPRHTDSWDANVGARTLYKLIGAVAIRATA